MKTEQVSAHPMMGLTLKIGCLDQAVDFALMHPEIAEPYGDEHVDAAPPPAMSDEDLNFFERWIGARPLGVGFAPFGNHSRSAARNGKTTKGPSW